jgi:hypothetical protein
MKTRVILKDKMQIHQPVAQKEWKTGYIDGYCRAADDRCYAIVVTEHSEFEFVPIYMLQATGLGEV